MPTASLPIELDRVRDNARQALGPVLPISETTYAEGDFLFGAQRAEASNDLPPYYLIYFVLVDLLGFQNLGKFEKISWSVPVDYKGRAFLIEHRKFGVGVFVHDTERDETDAKEIVRHLKRAIKAAEPYLEWLADEALKNSTLNVLNNSQYLFDRFSFFSTEHRKKAAEAEHRKDERDVKQGNGWKSISFPSQRLRAEASWLALATIEAFFSWTEHLFIHIAILRGTIKTGIEIAQLAKADWSEKFKSAFDLTDPKTKVFYDELVDLRRALRNFIAHGAFGKDGEAFQFHSGAGAVPLMLPHRSSRRKVVMAERMTFDDMAALRTIDSFISDHLWTGPRAPARLYIEQSHLPVILTHVSDGSYAHAMQSVDNMSALLDRLNREWERAANMDW
ncbi:hypothetical protein [Bradyrhizobium aeschynomenes]|uniref:hypothetical protein n=1 Tax=Bradyrhizobium aeschynomenes TaxID=2734909 RepID=UPI0015560FA4|nr:hypothetical protein [Bradyrhizobium aeschynomenes]NPV22127.1 hypothetical protein [Bradyrhizobium aeschynomenes]